MNLNPLYSLLYRLVCDPRAITKREWQLIALFAIMVIAGRMVAYYLKLAV